MTVQALTSIDPNQFFNLRPIADAGLQRFDSHISGLSVSNDFSGRFHVTTAEGDTITLAAELDTAFQAGNYLFHGVADQEAGNGVVGYAQQLLQQDFDVTVRGDLNDQETQDLEKVFRNISSIFRGFFEGQDEDARAQTVDLAERFGSLASLSSLDLSVEVVRSISVAAASTGTPGGAPSTTAAIPRSSNGTTAPTPSSNAVESGRLAAPVYDEQLGSLIQQVFDVLKDAETTLHKFRESLPDYFKRLHEELVKELQGQSRPTSDEKNHSEKHDLEQAFPPTTKSDVIIAYSSVKLAAVSFSVQS